jgi:hypothetical protein
MSKMQPTKALTVDVTAIACESPEIIPPPAMATTEIAAMSNPIAPSAV